MFLGISYLKIQGSKRLFKDILWTITQSLTLNAFYNCRRITMPLCFQTKLNQMEREISRGEVRPQSVAISQIDLKLSKWQC